jgi:hypothetical protein
VDSLSNIGRGQGACNAGDTLPYKRLTGRVNGGSTASLTADEESGEIDPQIEEEHCVLERRFHLLGEGTYTK